MPLNLILYYSILLAVNCIIAVQWKHIGRTDRIICALLLITMVEEIVAFGLMRIYKNNMIVYHIYSPVELFLISLYFNYSVSIFRRRHIGLIAGITGIVLSMLNTLFIQHGDSINSYFLLFEAVAVIIFCLFSFHQILMDERSPYPFAQFWLTICLLVYWSATFTGWGIYSMLNPKEIVLAAVIEKVLAGANYIFYLGIGVIFLRYKKLIPSGA